MDNQGSAWRQNVAIFVADNNKKMHDIMGVGFDCMEILKIQILCIVNTVFNVIRKIHVIWGCGLMLFSGRVNLISKCNPRHEELAPKIMRLR